MASDAISQFGVPLPDPMPGASERRDRARSVSADLEAIFGEPKPPEAPPRAKPVGRTPRRGAEAPIRRLSAASLGGLAAAALAGIAAGSLLVKPTHHAAAPAAGPSLPRADALPVEMVPQIQTPQAYDAQPAAPAAPVAVAAAKPRVHARAPRVRHAAASADTVRAADRRLRAAYDAAIRAGAPHDLLVDYRDRWASVRRREAQDPARLVASYNAIAADLNRAAFHRQGRTPRRSLFRPRLASWWR